MSLLATRVPLDDSTQAFASIAKCTSHREVQEDVSGLFILFIHC
jgi:hypothetical protein